MKRIFFVIFKVLSFSFGFLAKITARREKNKEKLMSSVKDIDDLKQYNKKGD